MWEGMAYRVLVIRDISDSDDHDHWRWQGSPRPPRRWSLLTPIFWIKGCLFWCFRNWYCAYVQSITEKIYSIEYSVRPIIFYTFLQEHKVYNILSLFLLINIRSNSSQFCRMRRPKITTSILSKHFTIFHQFSKRVQTQTKMVLSPRNDGS